MYQRRKHSSCIRAKTSNQTCNLQLSTSFLHFRSGMVQSQPMLLGTLLNVAGILIGGIVGLLRRKPLSVAQESWFKIAIGAFTVFYGFVLPCGSLSRVFGQVLNQLLIPLI